MLSGGWTSKTTINGSSRLAMAGNQQGVGFLCLIQKVSQHMKQRHVDRTHVLSLHPRAKINNLYSREEMIQFSHDRDSQGVF